MKQYLKYFKWYFCVIAFVFVVWGIVYVGKGLMQTLEHGKSTNTERTTTERVFDYADVLTEDEENKLRKLIAKSEPKIGCDIVLVTLDEPLAEYAQQDSTYYEGMPSSQYVRIYADNFYDQHKFGYDMACGDGVLLLDNWSREDDGRIHTWFTTTGKAYKQYSDAMINQMLDRVYQYIEKNPYRAYKAYVDMVTMQMGGSGSLAIRIPGWIVVIVPIIVALVFVCSHLAGIKGKKTVTAATYIQGGRPDMEQEKDMLIRTHVTSRHIPRGDGGGGRSGGGGFGGGHVSSGGVSHGGGGRSR